MSGFGRGRDHGVKPFIRRGYLDLALTGGFGGSDTSAVSSCARLGGQAAVFIQPERGTADGIGKRALGASSVAFLGHSRGRQRFDLSLQLEVIPEQGLLRFGGFGW